MTSASEETAWAAGFFEGEGYFSAMTRRLKDGPRRYPYVGINNTDLEMLERFQRIVGVGTISARKADTKFNSKPQWRWIATRRGDTEYVYELFKPWLSATRRAKADPLFDALGNLNKPRWPVPTATHTHLRTPTSGGSTAGAAHVWKREKSVRAYPADGSATARTSRAGEAGGSSERLLAKPRDRPTA